MNSPYLIQYRRPKTGEAGLAILTSECEITTERAKLESRGYVVTKVSRPIIAKPE